MKNMIRKLMFPWITNFTLFEVIRIDVAIINPIYKVAYDEIFDTKRTCYKFNVLRLMFAGRHFQICILNLLWLNFTYIPKN